MQNVELDGHGIAGSNGVGGHDGDGVLAGLLGGARDGAVREGQALGQVHVLRVHGGHRRSGHFDGSAVLLAHNSCGKLCGGDGGSRLHLQRELLLGSRLEAVVGLHGHSVGAGLGRGTRDRHRIGAELQALRQSLHRDGGIRGAGDVELGHVVLGHLGGGQRLGGDLRSLARDRDRHVGGSAHSVFVASGDGERVGSRRCGSARHGAVGRHLEPGGELGCIGDIPSWILLANAQGLELGAVRLAERAVGQSLGSHGRSADNVNRCQSAGGDHGGGIALSVKAIAPHNPFAS